MRLDDKRLVIEALLCAAGDANNVSLNEAEVTILGFYGASSPALRRAYEQEIKMRFSDRMAIAAYRLIESSPTLIREWFGGGK